MALITGVWANSNFDSEKENPRQQFIEALERDVNDKIAIIYGVAKPEDKFEIDKNAPFWAAMYRSLEAQHGTSVPTEDEVDRAIAGQKSDVKLEMDIDQEVD